MQRPLLDNKVIVINPQKGLKKVVSLSELEKFNPKFEPGTKVNVQRSEKSGGGIKKGWNVEIQFSDGEVLVRNPERTLVKRISPRKLKALNP